MTIKLSPLQQGMLFHALAAPHSGVDIEQIEMRLHESLDVEMFQRAWQRIIAHHPILRTRFIWEGVDEPRQCAVESAELPQTYCDLRNHPNPEKAIASYRQQDRTTDFDFATPPLMRLAIFQLADDDFAVLWTFHHILLDGRSFPIVLRDLFAVYADEATELVQPRPFSSYLTWRMMRDFANSDDFWRTQLAGFSAPTEIAFGAFGGQKIGRWGEVETHLTAAQTRELEHFASANNVTLHTLLQAAWAILLHHYSRENDVVFASTRACRYWAQDAKEMVGLFINTLPMRGKLDADTTLTDYLQSLRRQQVASRPHEHTPLPRVQSLSELPAGTSLFDSLVVYDNETLDARMAMSNRSFRYRGQTNFPLTILGYGGERLLLRLEHELGKYPTPLAERMLAQLVTLLTTFPTFANHAALQIPYLSNPDRVWLSENQVNPTHYWNDAFISVAAMIAEQVRRAPDKVAIRFQDESVTYAQLAARSDALAVSLREMGVRENVLVGLAVARSAELPIAMLGILKAGGAYVPLDPTYPRDRLSYMLNDSAAPIIVINRALAAKLPLTDQKVLHIEDVTTTGHALPPSDLIATNNLAYVIYTSGSTGKPKGVQLPERALANFLMSMRVEPGISAADRTLALTTISFDIAALEIFLPLISGAELTIADDATTTSPHAIAKLMIQRDITLAQATPATWRMLIEADWQGKRDLRILSGGEPLSRKLSDALLARGAELWNMYGPTETTIWSTVAQVCPNEPITIGRPIANTTVHILDRQYNPVPAGTIGELCIGGAGVSKGYLNRPKLSAEKFIQTSGTVYRTGDLARFNPDGTLTCFGRVDHQVKVRGYRIELGEIEAVLAQHAAVQAACVVARKITNDEKQLVAYLVTNEEVTPTALRKHAKTKLPDYMVPAAFVMLDAFPLTNNGKINRRALPSPDHSRPISDTPLVSPRTQTERAIADVWQNVLLINEIGIHDSFFELGGDSLLVVRAVSQLRDRFHTKLGVHKIFEHRTISELAQFLDVEQTNKFRSSPMNEPQPVQQRVAKRQAALQRRRKMVSTL